MALGMEVRVARKNDAVLLRLCVCVCVGPNALLCRPRSGSPIPGSGFQGSGFGSGFEGLGPRARDQAVRVQEEEHVAARRCGASIERLAAPSVWTPDQTCDRKTAPRPFDVLLDLFRVRARVRVCTEITHDARRRAFSLAPISSTSLVLLARYGVPPLDWSAFSRCSPNHTSHRPRLQ